jgi:two-component system OmpR family sensor kinase
MRIRWRLTWYGIGFTAMSLFVFMILILLLVAGSGGNDQDVLLSSIADDAATVISGADAEQLSPTSTPVLLDASTSDQPFITVYDATGGVYYATGTVNGETLDLPAAVIVETLEIGSSAADVSGVRVQVRRWENGDVGVGVVSAAQSLRVVEAALVGARWFLIVFAFIALIAAAIGAWFMSGRALRPLNDLARTTDDIGTTGDLTRRLPPVTQDDEVGGLTTSFNRMLEGIESARRERDLTIDAQRRFVADASHELRSPLTSIRANAGFLANRTGASEEDKLDATRDISAEADRMSELIDDLLTLARADARTDTPAALVPVDLVGVVRSVERRARNLPISVAIDVPAEAVVLGDYASLAELVWILIDNADRHGGDNVIANVRAAGDDIVFSVSDDGPGIPDGHAGLVFDRFHRAESARSGPGYGLGLAIARSIVDVHGGTITASNGDDGGAVFSVVFPRGG